MRRLIKVVNPPPRAWLRTSPQKHPRGAAMVEMAIVLPVLLILTLGLIEYGWVFLRVSQVNMAARHGVRTAVRPDATTENVTAAVAAMMTSAGISSDKYTLTHTDLNAATGAPVSVHIAADYSRLTLTGTSLFPVPGTIQGHGTMAKERAPTAP
jgi:Flp pilus assembly protein TadG